MAFDTNQIYPKTTVSKLMIRFQDCDPFGHLNNAKYFDYFFNGREDQVPKVYGVNPVDFYKKHKTGWVVYHQQISYLRSALPGEWVQIFSSLIFYNENTLVIEYYMANEAGDRLMAVLWTTLRYIDAKTGKTIYHQPEVTDFLKAIHMNESGYPEVSFEQRVQVLKNMLKAKASTN